MISSLISIMRLVFLPAVSNPQLWIFLKDLRYHSGNLHLGTNYRLQMNHMLICLEMKKKYFLKQFFFNFMKIFYIENVGEVCSCLMIHSFLSIKENSNLIFFSSSFSFRSKINSMYVVFEYL